MRKATIIAAVALVAAVASASWPRVHAQQRRSARDGIYAAAQATRGAALYQAKCATCHGDKLEGAAAPPLAGDGFLGAWGSQPVADLVDKVHNTMPADAPGSLTMPQVADIVARMLEANQFPAGNAVLDGTNVDLKQVTLAPPAPAAPRTAAAGPAVTAVTFPAAGNLNQVMRGILFPSSNILFDVQTQDPGSRAKGPRAEATTTSARYGDVYEPWQVVDAAAIALAESAPLLLTPGRRCENGKPVPVDRPDWQRYVQGLAEVGREAYKASQTRNQATMSDVTNKVSDACANCHKVYRDVPTNAARCTPAVP